MAQLDAEITKVEEIACFPDPMTDVELKTVTTADNVLLAQGHAPVLNRTFNLLGTLGLGFSITNSWLSYASCFGQSLLYGGPQATVFGLILACVVQWIVALGLAEQASALPSSGGQYHFTYVLAPKKTKRLAAYCVGVLSIIGWWVITCSGISNNVQAILGTLAFMDSSYQHKQWHSYLLYIGLIACTLIPIFTVPQRHLGLWTQGCLTLSILAFIGVTATILAMADTYNDASFLLEFNGTSGWPDGMAWIMSVGNTMYAFASIDAVIHVAEEMHHPGKEIPRAINLTMFIGLITALPFTIALMFVMKDLDAVRSSPLPSLELFHQATGSKNVAVGLEVVLIVVFYTCMPSQWITCGRLTWAFARDNGIPWSKYWNHVSGGFGFPVRTTWLSVAFCVIYGVLYVVSVEAFNSIIITAVLRVNISYIIPQAIAVVEKRSTCLPSGHFNLGKFGILCNIWSPLWITFIGIAICFPNSLPVTAETMNYVCVVLGFICLILFSLWFVIRKTFDGPQVDREALEAIGQHAEETC